MTPDSPPDQPPTDDHSPRPVEPPEPARPAGSDPGDPPTSDRSLGDPLSGVFGLDPVAPDRDPLIGREIGGVRLVRVIGQGGMGKVYEGEQQKPRFTVAVKVMRPGLATPAMRKRFEYEAEILARLRHPGIAQIFSAGVEPVLGVPVPYFVMEYIPGARSLTDYAAALKLSKRARLDLFRSVCEAVAHGHQKGVVHRDLKPANILVDATGQPKVIDFGVAKATDSDLAITTTHSDLGQLIGTLQYMGPEQFDGDPNEIDTRCDVYALGVVLYELLTGKLPYDVRHKAVLEVMRIVKEEEPTPISAFDNTLRRDVAVIAGKCLEKDRARRYSSASELGDDVARHLAGEPIQASPPSFIDGLVRLARKHRAATAATAGIAASLVAAVVGISVFAFRAERQRVVANEATVRAERARETAVTSRNAAEELVAFMTFDLRAKLEPIGRLDLMEEVLEKLEAYHDERTRLEDHGLEGVSPHDLRRRAAFFVSRGDLAAASGDLRRARDHFEKHLAIMEKLCAQDPLNTSWQQDLASGHRHLGDMAQMSGDLEQAREHFERDLAITEALSTQDPQNAAWRRELASSHNRLGDLAQATGDLEQARDHFEKDLAIMQALSTQDPQNTVWKRDLAVSHGRLGRLAEATGDLEQARDHFEKDLAIVQTLSLQDPRNATWQRDLAVSHNRLGGLAQATGDRGRARDHFARNLAIMEQLCRQDPRNAAWQRELAVGHHRLGDLAEATGDLERALDHFEKTRAIIETLCSQDPRNAAWQVILAISHGRLGDPALAKGDFERARDHFEKAQAIMEQLCAQDAQNAEWQIELATSERRLGDLYQATGDLRRAGGYFEKNRGIMERLCAQDPRNAEWLDELGASHGRIGVLAQAMGDLEHARYHCEKDVAVTETLSAQEPQSAAWRLARVIALARLGEISMAQEAWPEARDSFVKGIEIADTTRGPAREAVLRILKNLAVCHRKLGDDVLAEECEKRLRALLEVTRRGE